MQHFLARPELVVERDGRLVTMVGLDIDDPGAATGGDLAQMPDQSGRDTSAAMRFGDREVVDVDLATRLFELVEFIGDQPTHDILARQRHESDDMLLGEQTLQIGIAWRLCAVGLRFGEGFAEHRIQLANERNVAARKAAQCCGRGRHSAKLAQILCQITLLRLLPGVMGNVQSGDFESFESGLLEHPHYTRPAVFEGLTIPEILTSGNHALIEKWRREQAETLTRERRPDLRAGARKTEKNK
jgi:hypothetical protein